MRRDKDSIFKLRKNGKSYRDIQKEFDISRSTLCGWFKNEEWSKHIRYKNDKDNTEISTTRINKMNFARGLKLEAKYRDIIEEAKNEYQIYRNDPLFSAGLMLYAGEGDHLSKGAIKLANIDFDLHKVFINFSKRYLKTNIDMIKFSILLYPDLNIDKCLERWNSELKIPKQNMYKPQVILGKFKKRKLHFGVGTSIILDSFLKHKLLFWINQLKSDLSKY
jgi:hypothetical protein